MRRTFRLSTWAATAIPSYESPATRSKQNLSASHVHSYAVLQTMAAHFAIARDSILRCGSMAKRQRWKQRLSKANTKHVSQPSVFLKQRYKKAAEIPAASFLLKLSCAKLRQRYCFAGLAAFASDFSSGFFAS